MCETCRNVEWPLLSGRRVVVGASGSISIYRLPDIIRELKVMGADVHAGLSGTAESLVGEEVFRWATGHDPVVKITGKIEHISLFEKGPENTVLLLAPATYNVIGKVASGISDTVPSVFFSYAFGAGVPVIVAPAMHRAMLENRILDENIVKLRKLGIDFVDPEMDPEKAKLSDEKSIIDHVCRAFYGGEFKGKKILIVSGRTEESIDPVRTVTNRSSGITGYWLCRNVFRLGAEEIVFAGNSVLEVPGYVESHIAYDTTELYELVENLVRKRKFDIILVPAAISDFSLTKLSRKADSSKPLNVALSPREKLLDVIRRNHKGILVASRLNDSKDNLKEHFSGSNPDFIVFNRIVRDKIPFGNSTISYDVLNGGSEDHIAEGSKEEATFRLLVHISGQIRKVRKK